MMLTTTVSPSITRITRAGIVSAGRVMPDVSDDVGRGWGPLAGLVVGTTVGCTVGMAVASRVVVGDGVAVAATCVAVG